MGPRPISRGEYVTCHARNKNPAASMGPRPISRGEKTAGSLIDAYLGLQWGRGRSAAERPKERSSDRGTFWLQWGRGRSAAERSRADSSARQYQTLQWGRGRSAAESRGGRGSHDLPRSFNGAAADQPRRGSRQSPAPSSLPGFNGAAADQPRRGIRNLTSPPWQARFNGA